MWHNVLVLQKRIFCLWLSAMIIYMFCKGYLYHVLCGFYLAPKKCNDTILRTGSFGEEPCDLNDFFAKDMQQTYDCIVLPCEDGEFAFADKGYRVNGYWIAIFMMALYYICFMY